MVEREQLLDMLCTPLEGRGQQPAQGEDEPPEKSCHHGVVEEAKDNDTRSVFPAPGYRAVHKLASGTSDVGAANGHGEEVGE